MIHVIGHKNPDTDSICSAISLAYFLDATAAKLGEINSETTFVLEKFSFEQPITLTQAKGKDLYLVDHCEKSQSIDDLEEARLLGIIDHHKVGLFTCYPIIYISKPIGSTASIIAELYFLKNLEYIGGKNKELSPNLAGILLSGIISDTLLFKSPTTTDLDIDLAKKLAQIANIKDLEEYGKEMLIAKSSIVKMSAEKIFKTGYKEFCMNNFQIGISQVEILNLSDLNQKKIEIFERMKKEFDLKNLDLILFIMTDIIKEGSEILVYGNTKIFENSFKVKLKNNSVFIHGMISRKKQVVPILEKNYLSLN